MRSAQRPIAAEVTVEIRGRLASFLALDFLPDPVIVGIGVFHFRGAVPHAFHVVSKAQATLEFSWSSMQLETPTPQQIGHHLLRLEVPSISRLSFSVR